MDKEDAVGRPTGAATITVERGPVAKFAEAVHNDSSIYTSADAAAAAGFDGIPVPPTYFFSADCGLGSRGRPRKRSPTMFRWISAVPPQIVSEREKKNVDTMALGL